MHDECALLTAGFYNTHWLTRSLFINLWIKINFRCFNPPTVSYKIYIQYPLHCIAHDIITRAYQLYWQPMLPNKYLHKPRWILLTCSQHAPGSFHRHIVDIEPDNKVNTKEEWLKFWRKNQICFHKICQLFILIELSSVLVELDSILLLKQQIKIQPWVDIGHNVMYRYSYNHDTTTQYCG